MAVPRLLLFALAMLLVLAWTGAGAMAQEAQRLALLIANQSYAAEVGPLKNPRNDIRVVGTALGQVGFDVGTPLGDATREQILLAVHDFADRLAAAGPGVIGFLYYSGHGVAVGGDNIIVPVSAKSTTQRELAIAGVKLDQIAATLNERAPQALHFIVFDACRNNLAGTRGAKGFVPVAERPGMFISFSTAPGSTASDDGQDSGPYAAALASEIVVPDRNHGQMFFEVRRRVAVATGRQQIPWTRDGLLRRVHFGGPAVGDLGVQPRPPPTSEAAQVWAVTKETTDKAVLEAFIARYKESFQAELARARLRSLEAQARPSPTASLPAPSSLAPTREHPFDGAWEASFAGGEQCPTVSGKYTIVIEKSVVQRWGGSVNSGGEVTIHTPAAKRPNLTVRHTLKLAESVGSGTFLTIGTACVGTETIKRLAAQ